VKKTKIFTLLACSVLFSVLNGRDFLKEITEQLQVDKQNEARHIYQEAKKAVDARQFAPASLQAMRNRFMKKFPDQDPDLPLPVRSPAPALPPAPIAPPPPPPIVTPTDQLKALSEENANLKEANKKLQGQLDEIKKQEKEAEEKMKKEVQTLPQDQQAGLLARVGSFCKGALACGATFTAGFAAGYLAGKAAAEAEITELKKHIVELEAEIKRLNAELEELRKKAPDQKQLEELRKQLADQNAAHQREIEGKNREIADLQALLAGFAGLRVDMGSITTKQASIDGALRAAGV
jgi:regulator of replication initiation timing